MRTEVPPPEWVERIQPEHLEPNTLGLVVFGPGEGESIVVLLPDGQVGVVDGCREPTRDEATGLGDPVREFLNALEEARGEPLELCFVCLTHPHEDHYRGLGRLLEAYRCRVRHVWSVMEVGDRYTQALHEYVQLSRAGRNPIPDDVDLGALGRVIEGITEASKQKARFQMLLASKLLLKGEASGRKFLVEGCGPADEDVRSALHALVERLEEFFAEEGTPTVRFDPNATSGALLIRWGKAGVLLGGDLLCRQGRYQGWDLVAPDIEGPVQVVKLAHHASREAHHEELWKKLDAPLALVTPFKKASSAQPPRPEQIAQLAQDSVVVITAKPEWPEHKDNPRPASRARRAGTRRGIALPLSRNGVVPTKPKATEYDTHNAVAVSLDADGHLLRLVLAGKADIYKGAAKPPARRARP